MPMDWTPYRSPNTGTLLDLMQRSTQTQNQAVLASADARARATQARGQAYGGAIQDIGQRVGATLNTFLKYREDQPKRDLERLRAGVEQAELTTKQRDLDDETMTRQAIVDAGGDPEQALATLRTLGPKGLTAAGKLQKQIIDGHKATVKEQHDTLMATKDSLAMASQLLQSVPDAGDDPSAPSYAAASDAYAKVLPKVRQIVGPDFARQLPDAFDPAAVQAAITWGETTQQTMERRRLGLEAARQALAAAGDKRASDKYFTEALGQSLPTVTSQEEWDNAIASYKSLGATDETIAKFGAVFSPEAAKRAEQFALTPAERARQNAPPSAGTIEAYATAYANERNRPVETLTTKEQEDVAHRWARAHKTENASDVTDARRAELVTTILKFPSVYQDLNDTMKGAVAGDLAAKGFTAFGPRDTGASRAVAERWKFDALKQLRDDYSAERLKDPKDKAKYDEERQGIETTYLAQIGQAKPANTGPAAEPTPAPGTPAGGPANVTKLLQTQKPGTYTLSDGTKWKKGADGTVVEVK